MNRLLIDIGNRRLKWRYLSPGQQHSGAIETAPSAVIVQRLQKSIGCLRDPDRIAISSVADPEIAETIARHASENWNAQSRIMESLNQQNGLHNCYDPPQTLGVDRWLAMIGAIEHIKCKKTVGKGNCEQVSKGPLGLAVVDAGTAVTVDLVLVEDNNKARFLGGVIFPGIETMQDALVRETIHIVRIEQSPDAETVSDRQAIAWRDVDFGADHTNAAISQGAVCAVVGGVDFAVRQFGTRLGDKPQVFVTGGDAGAIKQGLWGQCEVFENLVLDGIQSIVAGNMNK
ncbi:MAG: type III pantothenate kinase [Pseudomonadota bacterium]